MDVAEKIGQAKTALVIRHPFFGVACSMLPLVEERGYPTMATDGHKIYYNPDFVEKLTPKEVMVVLMHEVYHVIFYHCGRDRMAGRDHDIWGFACDYVINAPLHKDVGYEIPKGGLLDDKFYDKTAEEAYEMIKDKVKKIDITKFIISLSNGDIVVDTSALGRLIGNDIDEADIRDIILTAYESAKSSNYGSIPAGIERLVQDLRKSKVQWERMLARYIGSTFARDDYTYSHPNRRFLHEEMYLPSLRNEIIGDLVFAADTSGSMGPDDLEQIMAEIKKLSGFISKITVMSCDASVHEVVEVYQMENVLDKIKFRGGGGTDFRPVFNKIEESSHKPELLIYATDTYGTFPDKAPPYPVVWVSTVSKEAASEIPFGQVIYMQ